jgi:RecA-family ATPase
MGEIKGRFRRMSHGVRINPENVTLSPFKFRFNTPTGHAQLQDIINENRGNYPDVIILDALYKAVKGSLKDDNVINDFNHQWASFASACGKCARIVVHHLTKKSKDADGKYFKRADSDSFGSAFLLADVDHVFRLEKWGDDPETKERVLKCETQRSGQVIESLRLLLIEPDPLYFREISIHTEEKALLVKLFNKYPVMTKEELLKHSKIKQSTLYKVLEGMIKDRTLDKDGNIRPVRYWLSKCSTGGTGLDSNQPI